MALLVTASLTNNTVSPSETMGVSSLSVTPAGTHEWSGRDNIGTTEETLTISADIGTNGYLEVINRDATNFVQIGYTAGVYFAKLLAGYAMVLPLDPSVTLLKVKADTAACQLQFKLYESA